MTNIFFWQDVEIRYFFLGSVNIKITIKLDDRMSMDEVPRRP